MNETEQTVIEMTDEIISKPVDYDVIMMNDNYTPMDFVVSMLIQVFNKSQREAMKIMLSVHEKGSGIAGTYSKDIAESKSLIANKTAESYEYPFTTIVKPSK